MITRVILCGLTYKEIVDVAMVSPNKRAAAKRLGVSERQFYSVIKQMGMGHWFSLRKPRPRCISREDIEQLAAEGYIMKDAAHLAGVSYYYFRDLVREYGMADLFPKSGKAAAIARRGYAK